MASFKVFGSYGELTVDASTGAVLAYKHEPGEMPGYADIKQFDVDEWRRVYGKQPDGMSIDILDLGFWTDAGAYCAAEPSVRDEILSRQAAAE